MEDKYNELWIELKRAIDTFLAFLIVFMSGVVIGILIT